MASKRPSDATELRDLLLWARKEKITLGQVTVGSCTVVVLDLGVHHAKAPKSRNAPKTFLREMAGDLAGEMTAAGVLEPDDDDVTAVS